MMKRVGICPECNTVQLVAETSPMGEAWARRCNVYKRHQTAAGKRHKKRCPGIVWLGTPEIQEVVESCYRIGGMEATVHMFHTVRRRFKFLK